MLLNVRAELTYDFASPCETLVMLEAARGGDQRVVAERLTLTPAVAITRKDDPGGERRCVVSTAGRMQITYDAQVDVRRTVTPLRGAPQTPIRDLPTDALRSLRPSRYCPSDRLERFVEREFGRVRGGDRVEAILDWIAGHVDYEAGVSDGATDALDTFNDRAGVCRDFAHLAIALCRAGDVPARAVSAYAWGLEPPDLHAVAEVFVGGAWRLIDPTRLAPLEGMVRVATGQDAADIAFMSVFGEADLVSQAFTVARIDRATDDAQAA